jgi:hypothetical protein
MRALYVLSSWTEERRRIEQANREERPELLAIRMALATPDELRYALEYLKA